MQNNKDVFSIFSESNIFPDYLIPKEYEYWIKVFGKDELADWLSKDNNDQSSHDFFTKRDNNLKSCVKKYFQGNIKLWDEFICSIENDFSKIMNCLDFKSEFVDFIFSQNNRDLKEKFAVKSDKKIENTVQHYSMIDEKFKSDVKKALEVINTTLIEIGKNEKNTIDDINYQYEKKQKDVKKQNEYIDKYNIATLIILLCIFILLLIGVIYK